MTIFRALAETLSGALRHAVDRAAQLRAFGTPKRIPSADGFLRLGSHDESLFLCALDSWLSVLRLDEWEASGVESKVVRDGPVRCVNEDKASSSTRGALLVALTKVRVGRYERSFPEEERS